MADENKYKTFYELYPELYKKIDRKLDDELKYMLAQHKEPSFSKDLNLDELCSLVEKELSERKKKKIEINEDTTELISEP